MTEPDPTLPRDAVGELLDEAGALDDLESAMPLYLRALALDPDRAATHYNIGLVHKYRGAWAESLHHNRRASDLQVGHEAANWNMGIAATALRDWPAAREAWRRAGIDVDEGAGPIEMKLGRTPLRLNPDGDSEVVWGQRIDPVRAVLLSIPFPESGFRCGDVVLHDGAPVGEREVDGHRYSVFNVLELFEASASSTWLAEVDARDPDDLRALTDALDAAQVDYEDWTSDVRILCKQCSEGLPHEHHDRDGEKAWRNEHLVGISATSPDAARAVIERWSASGQGFLSRLVHRADNERLLSFECVLAGSHVH